MDSVLMAMSVEFTFDNSGTVLRCSGVDGAAGDGMDCK